MRVDPRRVRGMLAAGYDPDSEDDVIAYQAMLRQARNERHRGKLASQSLRHRA
jgi:hypothetical protein